MLFMVTCGCISLTPAQRNYSIIELVLNTIVYAITDARHWLAGAPSIKVFIKHSPLKHLSNKFLDKIPNPQLIFLCKKLMDQNNRITTIPGNHNKVTNFLSRIPRRHAEMPKNIPFTGQVGRITPYKDASLRLNWVLTNISMDGRKEPTYQACIGPLNRGRT